MPACTISSVVSRGSFSDMDRSNSSRDSTSRPSTLGALFPRSRLSVDFGDTFPPSSASGSSDGSLEVPPARIMPSARSELGVRERSNAPRRTSSALPVWRHFRISSSSIFRPWFTRETYLPRRNRSAMAEMPRVHQPRSRSLARTVSVLMVPVCGRSGSASMMQISSAVTSWEWDSLTVYMTILPAGSDHSMRSVPLRYSPPLIFLTHGGASFSAKKRR